MGNQWYDYKLCLSFRRIKYHIDRNHFSFKCLNAQADKVKFLVINDEFAKAVKWILSFGFMFPPNSSRTIFTVGELVIHCENPGYDRFITNRTPLFVFIDPFGYNGNLEDEKLSMQSYA